LKDEKIKLIAFTAAFLVTMIIIVSYIFLIDRVGHDDDDEWIIPGRGYDGIGIGDPREDILEKYGEPEETLVSNYTIWWSYRDFHGVDFLFTNSSNKLIEFRFNEKFKGSQENGIGLGTDLNTVLNEHGGALMRINVSYVLPAPEYLEKNRVLYTIIGEEDIVKARVFFDQNEGILYWFNMSDIVTQIVVV